MRCRVVAQLLWKKVPWNSGSQHEQDRIQGTTIIDTLSSTRWLWRKVWFNQFPLLVGQEAVVFDIHAWNVAQATLAVKRISR